MHFYTAFGQRLSSSIPLPELKAADAGPVRWNFRVVQDLADRPEADLLGEEPIYGQVSARLYRHAGGYRISVDDTGSYDLLDGCREIQWLPNDDPWWDFGRSHLIGRVLATALQLSNIITLHGSGVELDGGVIGFLAPKHAGKSTLAMMLYRAGARFVTDDALPLISGNDILALPGIQSLRVRPGDRETAALAGLDVAEAPGRDGKLFLPPFPDDRSLLEPTPLVAIYLLSPRPREVGVAAVTRRRLRQIPATIHLLGQSKIAAMLGSSFGPQLLEAITSVAARVPVYELSVMRDLDRLPEVVEQILEWHGAPAGVMAGAPAGEV